MRKKSEKVEKVKDFDKRLGCWQVAFAIFAIGLIVHLFFIQVVDLKKLRLKAKKQRSAQSFVMRGDIYDRNGIKLASDKILFDVYARTPDYEHTPEELANMLAPILKIPKSTLVQKLKRKDIMISLKKNVKNTLNDVLDLLDYGAIISVISFHSLEDRIVKEQFKYHSAKCHCPKEQLICRCEPPKLELVNKKPIVASEKELKENPPSRSAKLRVAKFIKK